MTARKEKPLHHQYPDEWRAWVRTLVDCIGNDVDCDPRWAISFAAFMEDMGPMPKKQRKH